MTSTILSAYSVGNTIGEISTYVLVGLMAIVLIYAMFKYLNTEDLHD
jgi:uncharacterized membrane protein YuzA (DUF378 family)